MTYFRMLLPDGTVHAEAEVADGKAAHAWAIAERGRKSGVFGYKLQSWDGRAWADYESSEMHVGTTPRYVFVDGPTDPPAGWSDN